jgi:hypothetical protein
MSNAFAPIVRARPNPIFGRPVHQGSLPFDYSPILLLKPFGFRIAPDTLSSGIRRATGSRSVLAVSGFRLRARLDFSIPSCSPGQRGITPAFGYSAPHPSAEGTSTPMIHALPSAHYGLIRLLIRVHARRAADHERVYIGETGNVGRRLSEHAADPSKSFACEAYVISGGGNAAFDKTAALYLQHRLTRAAEAAGLVEVQKGSSATLLDLPAWRCHSIAFIYERPLCAKLGRFDREHPRCTGVKRTL